MVNSCYVVGCSNRVEKVPGVRFYRFPHSDSERCAALLVLVCIPRPVVDGGTDCALCRDRWQWPPSLSLSAVMLRLLSTPTQSISSHFEILTLDSASCSLYSSASCGWWKRL